MAEANYKLLDEGSALMPALRQVEMGKNTFLTVLAHGVGGAPGIAWRRSQLWVAGALI